MRNIAITALGFLAAIAALAAVPGTGGTVPTPNEAGESLSHVMELPENRGSAAANWGRDIFVPLLKGIESAPELRLSAIFFNTERPSALINDTLVHKGSLVGGQKVVDIGRTHVILQGNIGTIRLEIAGVPELEDAD